MAAVVVILALLFSSSVMANPEQGKWIFNLDQDHLYAAAAKHMYNGTKVAVSVALECSTEGVEIQWMLRMSPCAMEFISAVDEINANEKLVDIQGYMTHPISFPDMPYDKAELFRGKGNHSCDDKHFKLNGDSDSKLIIIDIPKSPQNVSAQSPPADSNGNSNMQNNGEGEHPSGGSEPNLSGSGSATDQQPPPVKSNNSRKKRAATGAPGNAQQGVVTTASTPAPAHPPGKVDHDVLARAWVDANYLFMLKISPKNPSSKFSAEVTIRMFYGDESYVSALDYPLLIFYGILGLVYIFYGIIWLILLACNWRDLLRVQFWIGGVILLGMLEKAVFFAEYENINKTGVSVYGAVIFAELVSCLKRTLARMLVIIVSLGFGIVKPRLGQAFHKVLFVGGLFFILAAIEGCMRATTSKADQSNQFLLAAVPLAVLDAIICWWIFSSLIQTTRTLRLRRNVVKLTLYRHFTNTLIFAVLASVAYMIWFMTQHKFKECIKDWKQLWVDEAFWHMLFVVLLFIIMLLWRPTVNNQRYAFSPLLDAADEEEDEDTLMNDAFDGMKMRGTKANGSPKQRDQKSKVEDDLKWVEENIPASVADKALPTLLDSDEELMTTKFEMSKME